MRVTWPKHSKSGGVLTPGKGDSSARILWSALLALWLGPVYGQAPLESPGPQVLTEARTLVQSMLVNPRGPYLRIRWFCNDGTVQPPQAYACRERGGGRQHAEYSADRERLAALGWPVGTIFAALSWEELWDAEHRHQRLRALALERYLTDIDDGWVLRPVKDYRGRVQIEDEEAAGRELLLRLLADADWVAANYLLARESVRVIPHGGSSDDKTRVVRRDAIDIAERDRSFEPLRVEIHTTPSAATADRVRAWAQDRPEDTRVVAIALADELDALYGAAGRRDRIAAQRLALARQPVTAALAEYLSFPESAPPSESLEAVSQLLREARATITSPLPTSVRLLLFDVIGEVESELAVVAAEILDNDGLSRGELLSLASRLVDATYGVGLLTDGEYRELNRLGALASENDLTFETYRSIVGSLRRLPQWAIGSVRYAFAEPLIRYSALDARAAAFTDDLLRSSPLVGIAEVARRLARDLASMSGVTQNVNGRTGVAAFGINAGVAIGNLRIFESADALEHGYYERSDIVLLPETVAELSPVAGILTLGEGSPLSHVQLLARNFGIPNIAVVPDLLPSIRPLESRQVLAAVASDGSLVLTPAAELEPDLRNLLRPANEVGGQLTVPRPDLSVRQPIRLADLNASLSGRNVGPKAANLGELARLFPGRVAPAVAVPFGIFAEHMQAGNPSLRSRLEQAYAQFRAGEISEESLSGALASIRRDIAALEISAQHRADLVAAIDEEFGSQDGYGLFLRSDTNVEDLPQFTGAGLSETVPNLVGLDGQITAIPRVWASVLSPRAIAWRSNLLTNPEEVYASVLLMRSVPSDKSGVMVTADLTGLGTGLTVSTGWGVGGAVAGEAVETVVLRVDGGEVLVSEAKTAYQRALNPAGGMLWRPAPDGPVLTAADKRQLRALAAEVLERYNPVYDDEGRQRPWDIEFGFVDGELTLFQIRPLVERAAQLADRIVRTVTPRQDIAVPATVGLAELPRLESD
ncbi:MAG: hypothetical protein OEQ25_10180 [Gammaproteobacteria bacterium]|nr:hypothetical protein [Gammaproteobacteria bacterium]